nr:Imm21 family immunity protein [Streptomyces odonnellii]
MLHQWSGCTEDGIIVGGTDQPDDYDRACAVDEYAEVISLGDAGSASVLVLGDGPATTCYLPEHRAFVRCVRAESEAELVAAAAAVLGDEATPWEEECGIWETDGPAVLMDSAEAGEDLGPLVWILLGSRAPAPRLAALSSVAYSPTALRAWEVPPPRGLPPPPCDPRHQRRHQPLPRRALPDPARSKRKTLGVPYPDGRGQPEEAPVPVPAGRWRVRVFYEKGVSPSAGVVQLLPAGVQLLPTAGT